MVSDLAVREIEDFFRGIDAAGGTLERIPARPAMMAEMVSPYT